MSSYNDLLHLFGEEYANREIKNTFKDELDKALSENGVNENDLSEKFDEIIVSQIDRLIFKVSIDGIDRIILEI